MVTSSLRDQRKEANKKKNEMGKGANPEARRVLGEEEGGVYPKGVKVSYPGLCVLPVICMCVTLTSHLASIF